MEVFKCEESVNLVHYFPYDVKLRLLAHIRSFSTNQKARNAIVGAENLLKVNSQSYFEKSHNLQIFLNVRVATGGLAPRSIISYLVSAELEGDYPPFMLKEQIEIDCVF